MSKIAIIGATGRAGSQLLEEALRRGHSVLAIARDPSRLQGRDGVTVKALDAKDSAALQAAVEGVDAVLARRIFRPSSRTRSSSLSSAPGSSGCWWWGGPAACCCRRGTG